MKRLLCLIALAAFILTGMVSITACGSENGSDTTTTPAQTTSTVTEATTPTVGENEVQFTDEGVYPKELTISVGTTVTFGNNDNRENSRHWIKALDGSFDTRAIPKHARMDVTFNEVGIFEYHCLFHKDRENEKGTIIVE